MNRYRVVFMGTPEFSLPCLKALLGETEVAAVVTQPDRPRGRGHKLVPSPVKTFAFVHDLNLFQPEKVRETEFIAEMKALNPDIIVVVAFGQILPKELLAVPKLGCINVHASLLPRWRGAAPMQWCLMKGETETGVTTMMMDAGLDTGDMLLKQTVPITPTMNFAELHDSLKEVGAELLMETLAQIETCPRIPQDDALATYAPMLTKETGCIDWHKDAVSICNLIRALDPAPGAYTFLGEQNLKIWRAEPIETDIAGEPGEVIGFSKGDLIIGTGEGSVLVKELQLPGGRRLSAADYLRGHKNTLPKKFAPR